MGLEQFKNRNVGAQNYTSVDVGQTPEKGMGNSSKSSQELLKGNFLWGYGSLLEK